MRFILYIFFLFSFCTDVFAQSEEHDPVYISTGCSAYAYHKTLFCGTIKSAGIITIKLQRRNVQNDVGI